MKTATIKTRHGDIRLQLHDDKAPKTVANFEKLAADGFYDGLKFHRVIEGFMAQTGCPKTREGTSGWGTGGSGKKLKAEFSEAKHRRGTVSMARSSDPNSGDSQFFICFEDSPFLNRQYTVWGTVIEGMENVDAINRGEPPREPDEIVSVRVAADAA